MNGHLISSLLVGLAIQPVQVRVEDRAVTFDAPPSTRNGVAMVPVRSMIDALGGTMRWDMANRMLTGWVNGKRFDVILNSREGRKDGVVNHMEEASFIHRGRIFASLRFIAEASGYLISQEGGEYVLRKPKR